MLKNTVLSLRALPASIAFLFAFMLLLCDTGNAAAPLAPAPDARSLVCVHATTAKPPTPEQIDSVRNSDGSDAHLALPLAAQGKRWSFYSDDVNHINAWTRARDGKIWLATRCGVKCVDDKAHTVRHDTRQGGSGLPAENITAIAAAENGDVWCFASQYLTPAPILDSTRRTYYLCRLKKGQARWQAVRTFKLSIFLGDTSLYPPGLLAGGRYIAIALPGEDHTPLLLWDGAVWRNLPIPEQPSSNYPTVSSLLARVSLVSMDDTHLSIITPAGFHALCLPVVGKTVAKTIVTVSRDQPILAAAPANRPARTESGYWIAIYESPVRNGFELQDSRKDTSQWKLVRVLPNGKNTMVALPPKPTGNTPYSPPHSLALYATDDGTGVWVAVTYQNDTRVKAQILRFDVGSETWKIMLTVSLDSPPGRPQEKFEGTPGKTPEDWKGIPMEMAAHLACYSEDAAFRALPTWLCLPQPLPNLSWNDDENTARVRTSDGDTWSIETREDGRILRREPAALRSMTEWFAPPPNLPLSIVGDQKMEPVHLVGAGDSLIIQFKPRLQSGYGEPSSITRFDRKARQWREIWYPGAPLGSGPEGGLYSLKYDGRSFWATTDKGLYHLDAKTHHWRNVAVELGDPLEFPLMGLGENAVEPGKSVWLARIYRDEKHPVRKSFLSRYDVAHDRWEHFSIPSELVAGNEALWQSVYAQEPGAVWLTTSGDPLRFDRKTHRFTRVGPALENAENLRYMLVLPDAQGVPIRWFFGSGIALRLSP